MNNGRIENNQIICNEGYFGDDCQNQYCKLPCGKGECVNGTCKCYNGWTGLTCNIPACLNECSYNGLCVKGKCFCKVGYKGKDCSVRFVENGKLIAGQVICDEVIY